MIKHAFVKPFRLFFFWRGFRYRARALARQTERDTETERRNHHPEGMVTPQSLLLHSSLGFLGTHAHAPGVSFKPSGPGRKPWLTTWESSDIAIMVTAGPTMSGS